MSLFEQKTTGSNVAVRLSNNSFDESTYFVRVPRDKVDIDNIVSEIAAGYPSLDPYVIIHSIELVKEQILKFLQQGKAVDVFDLGTMYLAPSGTVTKDNPQVSDLPSISLKFTPSSSAKEAISGITANSFMISDPSPQVSTVYDLYRMAEDWTVSAGQPARLTGGNLKLGDTADDNVFFVPQTSSGEPDPDTINWIEVSASSIWTNTPARLEFWVPATLSSSTKYYIYIHSTYLAGGRSRKVAVSSYSPEVVSVAT